MEATSRGVLGEAPSRLGTEPSSKAQSSGSVVADAAWRFWGGAASAREVQTLPGIVIARGHAF